MGNTSSNTSSKSTTRRQTAQDQSAAPHMVSTLSTQRTANERLRNFFGRRRTPSPSSSALNTPPPKPPRSFVVAAAAVASERGGQQPSSPYSFGRRANSALSTYSVRWKDGVVDTSPVPPKPTPKPPPKPSRSFLASRAAVSPILEVDEAQSLAATAPLPPPLPSSPKPPAPPPQSFLAAAATGRVRIATAASATQQPTSQRESQDNAPGQLAADAPTTLPAEHRPRRKHLQSGLKREAQPRRLNATTGRPLPRVLDEALDDETLLAIRRLATERKNAQRSNSYSYGRRANSAAGSFSVRWGGDLLEMAVAAAEAAQSPQPFNAFAFDAKTEAAAEDERLRECELRRVQHELYDAELCRRTCDAAAWPSTSARFQNDAFSVDVSTATTTRQPTTSAPASTTTSDWGAAQPASFGRPAGGDGGSSGGQSGLSGLLLCGRLQPEARYYDNRPVVPK